ncbi:MAG: glycosyltransferase [Chitinivibrionales bacterium]|nr:glycosyltransferase [Chitinivibrionales bacterium]MBD3355851.1 glycosyltransferase [Chitinivibrionales bacterium]
MRIGMLAPIAWRTPPRHYGPWERVTSLVTEELVKAGHDVTLFATADSLTAGRLEAVCPRGYEEDLHIDAKVWESIHIAHCFENASRFDIIHNHFDFLPLSFSRLVTTPLITTIHGFSGPVILPAYKRYDRICHYVSISDADRSPELTYIATIHHGIDIDRFDFSASTDDYLLFFGRFHHDKGAREAVEIAKRTGLRLIMAGIVQDRDYFSRHIEPSIDGSRVVYVGSVGPQRRQELLGGARALLHPINFAEPFGLSVVESMACGTPVIAFNKGSMPEIITPGSDGFLVNSIDEAVDAVGRVDEVSREACRETVERRFTSEIMAANYVKVYHEILASLSTDRQSA